MPVNLKTGDFLEDASNATVIDVRSEAEYEHAHIPGAVNIPLLNNENRKIIGTIYKEQGRESAISKGFELVGPLFGEFYEKMTLACNGSPAMFY
jgi:tRNA 2-selenouridine synthase